MAAGVVRIYGDKQIDLFFRLAPEKLAKKIERKALRKAGKLVLDAARSKVPVDSGALRKSLRLRAMKRSRKRKYTVGVRVTTGIGWFSGKQFYGAFLEFGTSRINASPFLRPAAAEQKHAVGVESRRAVKEAMGELAREHKA